MTVTRQSEETFDGLQRVARAAAARERARLATVRELLVIPMSDADLRRRVRTAVGEWPEETAPRDAAAGSPRQPESVPTRHCGHHPVNCDGTDGNGRRCASQPVAVPVGD